jgi:hypothetical protein
MLRYIVRVVEACDHLPWLSVNKYVDKDKFIKPQEGGCRIATTLFSQNIISFIEEVFRESRCYQF